MVFERYVAMKNWVQYIYSKLFKVEFPRVPSSPREEKGAVYVLKRFTSLSVQSNSPLEILEFDRSDVSTPLHLSNWI